MATLLYALGPSADTVLEHQLGLSDDDKKKFADVLKAFDVYFRPSTNTVHKRSKFELATQQPGQSVEELLRALYKTDLPPEKKVACAGA